MVASGGRGLQLRIWSPSASTKAKDDKKGSMLGGDSFTEVRLLFINILIVPEVNEICLLGSFGDTDFS